MPDRLTEADNLRRCAAPLCGGVIVDFLRLERSTARAGLEVELADRQQETADLAAENERQAELIEEKAAELERLAAEKATAEGKAGQLESDLVAAKEEATRERQAAEMARTELAKAVLRLEAMPRLESDLVAVRDELASERAARVDAEQRAAVLTSQKTVSARASHLGESG